MLLQRTLISNGSTGMAPSTSCNPTARRNDTRLNRRRLVNETISPIHVARLAFDICSLHVSFLWLQYRQAQQSIIVFAHIPQSLPCSNQGSTMITNRSKIHDIQPVPIATAALHLRRICPKLFQRRLLATLLFIIHHVMARLPARTRIRLTSDTVVDAWAAVVGAASFLRKPSDIRKNE